MDVRNCVVMKDQFDRIQAAKLKIQNKKFSVYKGVNVIGRNKSAVIDVKNLNVSQYHALIIIIDDSQHFISDLNSSNGTYLLGTKLSPFKLYELSNDSEVKFGDVVGLYLKMPNANATIHLENESMNQTQQTQILTQTFYAANTQILLDDSTLNQTVPHRNASTRSSEDIHEAATQVVDYPLTIPDRFLEVCENSNVITETVNCDIHDAPTQVVNLPPERPSTSKVVRVDVHEAPTQLAINQVEDNIHEMATQVVGFPQEKANTDANDQKKEDSDSTQLVTPEIPSNGNSSVIIQEKATVSVNQQEGVISENSNDSVDFLEISKASNTQMLQCNEDVIENGGESPTLSTQDIGQPKKRVLRKLSSSEDLSQGLNKKVCNSDSDTDIDDENVKNKIVQKSNSSENLLKSKKTNNPESDIDSDDDPPQKYKKRNRIIGSDSETDIEDTIVNDLTLNETDDVVKPKRLSKKIYFNSDSETDIEDNKENEAIVAQDQDSTATEILNDTDCIPPSQNAFANIFDYKNSKPSNSNSQNVSSEESFRLGLTELMVDGDEISKIKDIHEEDENHIDNENKNQMDVDEPSERKDIIEKNEESSTKKDDVYLMPTQMLDTVDAPVIENNLCAPKMVTVTVKEADDNLYMMPTQRFNEKELSGKQNNDIYLMPTQELTQKNEDEIKNIATTSKTVSDTDDDLYMMPTQKLNDDNANFKAPQKFTFKKKAANLDGSLTNILGSKKVEDPYSMDTQKINEVDDIYMQATQKLDDDKLRQKNASCSKDNDEEDIYLQPTQDLKPAGPSSERREVEEDPYMVATQQINQGLVNEQDKTKIPEGNVYAMETQQLNVGNQSKALASNDGASAQLENEDVYDQPTQPLQEYKNQPSNTVNEASKEPVSETKDTINSSSKREGGSCPDVPKRKRMKKSDIENLKKTIESKHRLDDAEILSQIEAFVKKPLEKSEDSASSDRVETLSQIEAFIKKPLENANTIAQYGTSSGSADSKEATETNKIVETKTLDQNEALIKKPLDKPATKVKNVLKKDASSFDQKQEDDRPETLSQIEAFVKQPLEAPPRKQFSKIVAEKNFSNELPSTSKKINEPDKGSSKQPEKTAPEKPIKSSTRTRGRQSRVIKEVSKQEEEKKESKEEAKAEEKDTNPDKNISNTSSLDIPKSDIDQSFALLEAKSTKTRKSLRSTGASEVKVALTKNRRSMTTSSIVPETESVKTKVATRKTRKTKVPDSIKPAETELNKRLVHKPEATKAKKKPGYSSGSDASEQEIPAKTTKSHRSIAIPSIAELPEPSTRKIQKAIASDNAGPSSRTKVGETSKRKADATKVKQKSGDSSDSDFSEIESPAKVMKMNVTRRGRSIGRVLGDITLKAMEPSTPSTSKTKANSRLKSSKNNEDTKSCDNESTSSSDPFCSTPRRGRNMVQNEALLTSVERTKRKQRPKVVFTMLDNPLLESYIRQLGGSIVDSVEASTVLVTEHVKRSQKLLTAVGQGKPICSPEWIRASKKANDFLDPWEFILIDKEAESKWNFSLRDSISKASNEKLLSNYTFQLMVNNAVDVLKGAIEACGGRCAARTPPKNAEGFFVIVAMPENRSKYLKIKKQHPEVTVVEPEAIFDGVLRQDLRLGRHLLT